MPAIWQAMSPLWGHRNVMLSKLGSKLQMALVAKIQKNFQKGRCYLLFDIGKTILKWLFFLLSGFPVCLVYELLQQFQNI